jgi:hypothetical protein
MQTIMNFYSQDDDVNEPFFATGKDIRDGLVLHIKKVGLMKYKDYYMAVKHGTITTIPAGIELEHFLQMVKDVYMKRAAVLDKKPFKKAA